jgi:hypothetical protein
LQNLTQNAGVKEKLEKYRYWIKKYKSENKALKRQVKLLNGEHQIEDQLFTPQRSQQNQSQYQQSLQLQNTSQDDLSSDDDSETPGVNFTDICKLATFSTYS